MRLQLFYDCFLVFFNVRERFLRFETIVSLESREPIFSNTLRDTCTFLFKFKSFTLFALI